MKNKNTEKQPFYKKNWFIGLVAIGIIGAIFGPKDEDKNETAQAEPTQVEEKQEKAIEEPKEEEKEEFAITEDMNQEQKIENIVKKVLEDQYDGHELVNNEDGQLGDINVSSYFPADKYWDGKKAAQAQDAKIIEILKLLKENNINYSNLVYEASSDFTDQYGNEKKDTLMTVLISKTEADKINFDSFDNENLKNIADNYYLHPSVSNQ